MQERNISIFNFENCQKCAICNTVCPVLADVMLYPGPKQAGPDGQRYRLKNSLFFDDALKYCLNCKRCEVACPSNVRVGDMIQAAKNEYGESPGLRELMLANTDIVGTIATSITPVVNFGLGLSPVKALLDATIGVAKQAPLPKYASQTFVKWFRKNAAVSQSGYPRQISYYHGCYVNYNYPQLGKEFVAVMNSLGYGVNLLEGERCCGIAKITNGQAAKATKDGLRNIALMKKAVDAGMEVVTVSTSCTLTILEEYPNLLGIDNSEVKEHIWLAERLIFEAVEAGMVKLAFKKDYKARVAYHCPCHQERLGWGIYTTELLRMVPNLELIVLESNCCGIAGTHGFKSEHFASSQSIGKPLFDQINSLAPDYVACECETCKLQIENATGIKVKNPISILAEALDLEATSRLNL